MCSHPGYAKMPGDHTAPGEQISMIKLILWCVLLLLCWPLALLALVLYPLIWLVLLPFRAVGLVVQGTFELISALFLLPARIVKAI